jgi:hypothetical protein
LDILSIAIASGDREKETRCKSNSRKFDLQIIDLGGFPSKIGVKLMRLIIVVVRVFVL